LRLRDGEHAWLPETQNPRSFRQRLWIVQAGDGDLRRPIIPSKKPLLEANQADVRPLIQKLNLRIARTATVLEQSSVGLSATIFVS
jgi:hypothetical protein